MVPDETGVARLVGARLIDVIDGVKGEVEPFGGEMPLRREVPGFVLAAATDAKPQLVGDRALRRSGHAAADPAHLAANAEAVEIFAIRLEPFDLDVHAMAEFRSRDRRPVADDRVERRIT